MSPLSFDEAVAQLTAPGAPFSMHEVEVDGRQVKVFDRTPASLRALYDTARRRGEKTFLVYEDERWSFDDVMAQVDAIGHLLVDRYGVGPGDRVAIAMRNYPEWITTFAAVTSIGAIAVCLNAWWSAEEVDYGLADCGATVLVADEERLERAAGAIDRLGVRAIVVRAEGTVPDGVDRLDDVLEPGAPLPEVEVAPDDDAIILYTSGTTGHPKGAVSTHRNVCSALAAFACRNAITKARSGGGERHPFAPCYILAVPLFHATGLIPVMLGCFAGGVRLVMMHRWDPARALELIERERVTVFVGVPTMSWDLLECPDFERRDTSSLQSVGGGGAPAPPELVRRIDDSFARGRPSIGYGMTETNAYGPQNNGDDYVERPSSAGRAVPTFEIRVVDADGRDVPVGERGEICFRGPNVFRGYWNKPEATAASFLPGGWLRSGDIGHLDDDGFVYVEDRAKDMVLRAGENIYCAEVEAVVYEFPGVYEAAAFGVPDERLGEELALAVYPKPGHTIDPEALRAHVGEHLAAFKVPSRVWVLDEQLPRNAAGKIVKRALRDRLAGAEA